MLLERGRTAFNNAGVPPEKLAFWWPNYVKQIEWVVAEEQKRRAAIKQLYNETDGETYLPSPLGKFKIFSSADRIEELKDGTLNIVDYKTGAARSLKEIKAGKAPQLPVEGLIAEAGGFKDVAAATVSGMQYWAFKDEQVKGIKGADSAGALAVTREIVQNLINAYADEKHPYLVKPRPSDVGNSSDYDHLSRLDEWCVHVNNKAEE